MTRYWPSLKPQISSVFPKSVDSFSIPTLSATSKIPRTPIVELIVNAARVPPRPICRLAVRAFEGGSRRARGGPIVPRKNEGADSA